MPFVSANEIKLGPGEIAVALGPGTFGSHIGVVFRGDADAEHLSILHLCWNEIVACGAFPDDACWIVARLDLPRISGLAIEELLRRLAASPPVIKYGVGMLEAEGSFSADGYNKPTKSDGLTCSTFVWQILRHVGLDPVVAESWPPGVNESWVLGIAKILFEHPRLKDPEQGAIVEGASLTARRLKPTELGVPICRPLEDWPMHFDVVVKEEPAIAAQLAEHCCCAC